MTYYHEAKNPLENRSNGPGWIPSVRVKIRNGKTESNVRLESTELNFMMKWDENEVKIPQNWLPSVWSNHINGRWAEGEVFRKDDLPMVDPTTEIGILWTTQEVVPGSRERKSGLIPYFSNSRLRKVVLTIREYCLGEVQHGRTGLDPF